MHANLISDGYRNEQQMLHEAGNYGTASIQYAPMVSQIIERLGVSHLLDYGCGSQCNLAKHLKVKQKLTYQAYDPGVPRFAKAALPAQMVACVDVLEHIEPDYLEGVLDDICRLTEAVCFLSIHTGPAIKTLSDGRNAHLIQQPMQWWLPQLWNRWDLQTVQVTSEHGFFVVGFTRHEGIAQ
jgi:hypothetical protein